MTFGLVWLTPLASRAGSNVTSAPCVSTAVHWLVSGQETACRDCPASMFTLPAALAHVAWLNGTSLPRLSTAVHCVSVAAGHATSARSVRLSTECGEPPAPGANVASLPCWSTAVHWL